LGIDPAIRADRIAISTRTAGATSWQMSDTPGKVRHHLGCRYNSERINSLSETDPNW
jgi:hypothetical protein